MQSTFSEGTWSEIFGFLVRSYTDQVEVCVRGHSQGKCVYETFTAANAYDDVKPCFTLF